MSILIKNVRVIVTCNDDDEILYNKDILLNGGIISKIGEGIENAEADRTIDGSELIMYPGLINAHHHLYQILTRNIAKIQKAELFDWLIFLYERWKNLSAESIRYSSMAGMLELLKNGCTTVFDHHYVFPKGLENAVDIQIQAAEELGVRFHASRGSMNRSRKDGGLPPDSVVQSVDEILDDSLRLIDKYHDPSFNSMRMVALAPCSPFSVSSDLMRETAKLARAKGVRLHTHLAETKDEQVYTLEKFNMRPLQYMEKLDWLGDDVWYAHGIHFNDEELKLLSDTGTGVAHCPISNMKLSSGVAQIPKMLKIGIPVGLAVDGSASNDGSNLLEEMRVCYLLHRLTFSGEAPSGYDILKMATRGSAKLLGRNDIGYIAEGMAADIFMVNSERIELAGCMDDPASIPATVGLKQPVDFTIVKGRLLVEKGKAVKADEAKIALMAAKEAERLISSVL